MHLTQCTGNALQGYLELSPIQIATLCTSPVVGPVSSARFMLNHLLTVHKTAPLRPHLHSM